MFVVQARLNGGLYHVISLFLCLSDQRKNTKLANYVWKKRDEGAEIIDIKWEVEKQCHSYTPGSGKCDVCLTEKLSIMKNRDPRSLNKLSELMNTCLHKKSWLLTRVKDR